MNQVGLNMPALALKPAQQPQAQLSQLQQQVDDTKAELARLRAQQKPAQLSPLQGRSLDLKA